MSEGDDVGLDGSLAVPGDGVVASCCSPVMELYLLRGSSWSEFTAAAAGADAQVTMDAEVWSKMPEELLWEVVRFVPAAKLFQLQLVSRQWRQELTSARFRKRLVTEESWEQRQQQERVVVACVSPPSNSASGGRSASSSSCSHVDCEVPVDVSKLDLSFVPSWFWSSRWGWTSYVPLATGHGLVCITNGHEIPRKLKGGEGDRFCVLNPLTRTCVVLPAGLPFDPDMWLLPSSATVAIWSAPTSDTARHLATYDLAAPAGAGAGWVRADKLVLNLASSSWSPVGALMDPPPAGPGGQATPLRLGAPPPTLLGLDEACGCVAQMSEHTLGVVHRGARYVVAELVMASDHVTTKQNELWGVWRVALVADGGGGTKPHWEGVALLDAFAEIERLTDFTCTGFVDLRATYAVREFVCFELTEWDEPVIRRLLDDPQLDAAAETNIHPARANAWLMAAWLLGFNLDTGKWELLDDREYRTCGEPLLNTMAMELRSDFFLS